MVPLDGSPQSETALPYSIQLTHHLNANLILFRVAKYYPSPSPFPKETLVSQPDELRETENYLLKVKEVIPQSSTPGRVPVERVRILTTAGVAWAQIEQTASWEKVDYLIMSIHGCYDFPVPVEGRCRFIGNIISQVIGESDRLIFLIQPVLSS